MKRFIYLLVEIILLIPLTLFSSLYMLVSFIPFKISKLLAYLAIWIKDKDEAKRWIKYMNLFK